MPILPITLGRLADLAYTRSLGLDIRCPSDRLSWLWLYFKETESSPADLALGRLFHQVQSR